MLQWLHIQNYVLIHELEIEFQQGLNIITGETGAGKSILMGALNLLTGVRAESDSLLFPDKKCLVEGSFDLHQDFLRPELEQMDIEYENPCILRREILPSGKSRAFINDTPVNLAQLKLIGSALIDIHSQHQTLLLSDSAFRMGILDEQAGNHLLRLQLEKEFAQYQHYTAQLRKLQAENKRLSTEQDFIRFQFDQLSQLPFRQAEEQDLLEAERDELSHAEEIKTGYQEIDLLLENESFSILSNLNKAIHQLHTLIPYHNQAREFNERLEVIKIELSDIHREVQKKAEQIDFNPKRLAEIQGKLDSLYQQLQKHKVSHLSELLNIKEDFQQKLSKISNLDEEESELQFLISQQQASLAALGTELTKTRIAVITLIQKEVTALLVNLGIRQARFEIQLLPLPEITANGIDEIRFLFTATPLHEPQEVGKVASGGELSRIMLCLKSVLANHGYKPCLIFDEIDTGVSGEIAHKTGKIIHQISAKSQVISITHLPQVAALGDYHYKVSKSEDGKFTWIQRLEDSERKEEIARLLSGEDLNDSAREHAENLLRK